MKRKILLEFREEIEVYPAGSWNSLPIIGLSDRSWNIGMLHCAWESPRFGCHTVTKFGSSALHCVGGPPSLTEGTTYYNLRRKVLAIVLRGDYEGDTTSIGNPTGQGLTWQASSGESFTTTQYSRAL